jgi:hypothetical protein
VIEAEGGSKGQIDLAKEVLHPGCIEGNVVELAPELLCLVDLEGATVGSPGGPEEVDVAGDELRRDADGHLVEVKDEA